MNSLQQRLYSLCLAFMLLFVGFACCSAEVETGHEQDTETGLHSWYWRNGTMAFSAEQRLPDQTRAFFLARGLPANAVEALAMSCIFQMAWHNTANEGGPRVSLRLEAWRVNRGDDATPLILFDDWQKRFTRLKLSKAPQIALRWSLFPSEQSFEPGDYNWGMVSYGPEPGKSFSLTFRWREGEKVHEATIEGMRCAEDR